MTPQLGAPNALVHRRRRAHLKRCGCEPKKAIFIVGFSLRQEKESSSDEYHLMRAVDAARRDTGEIGDIHHVPDGISSFHGSARYKYRVPDGISSFYGSARYKDRVPDGTPVSTITPHG